MTARRTIIVVLALMSCVLVLAAQPSSRGASQEPIPLRVPGKPSIPRGKEGFAANCASCHASGRDFARLGWRADLTPADVVRVAMGTAKTPSGAVHPAAVGSLAGAWDVAGYVWSLATDGTEVRHGEKLALEAGDALEQNALNLALFHLNELKQLKSGTWVLNHTQGEVVELMGRLAGERFRSLSDEDRRALSAYITLSYFVWPEDW